MLSISVNNVEVPNITKGYICPQLFEKKIPTVSL